MTKTSSGRTVKKINTYKEDVASTPPLKNSRKQPARTNGHTATPLTEDEEYESDNSVKRPKRKRTGGLSLGELIKKEL